MLSGYTKVKLTKLIVQTWKICVWWWVVLIDQLIPHVNKLMTYHITTQLNMPTCFFDQFIFSRSILLLLGLQIVKSFRYYLTQLLNIFLDDRYNW